MEITLYVWSSHQSRSLAAVVRDISERKQVERLREDVQRTIRHDLRSPLIGITGFARQLLKTGNLTEKQKEWASLVEELSEGMLTKINRSQDLFAMERGEYRLSPKQVDLLDLMRKLSLELGPIAEDKNATLAFFLNGSPVEHKDAPQGTYMVRGEKPLLKDLFANLIKNALEASQKTKRSVSPSAGKRPAIASTSTTPERFPRKSGTPFSSPMCHGEKRGAADWAPHSALLMAKAHGGGIVFTTSEKEGTHMIVTLPRSPEKTKKNREPSCSKDSRDSEKG